VDHNSAEITMHTLLTAERDVSDFLLPAYALVQHTERDYIDRAGIKINRKQGSQQEHKSTLEQKTSSAA
jgi:hypothetical protein